MNSLLLKKSMVNCDDFEGEFEKYNKLSESSMELIVN